jgi:hypothetical protein
MLERNYIISEFLMQIFEYTKRGRLTRDKVCLEIIRLDRPGGVRTCDAGLTKNCNSPFHLD